MHDVGTNTFGTGTLARLPYAVYCMEGVVLKLVLQIRVAKNTCTLYDTPRSPVKRVIEGVICPYNQCVGCCPEVRCRPGDSREPLGFGFVK